MNLFNHYIHLTEPNYIVFEGHQINNPNYAKDRWWNMTLALKRDPTFEHIEGMMHIDNIRGTPCTATTLCVGEKVTPTIGFHSITYLPEEIDSGCIDLDYWTKFPQYQQLFGVRQFPDRELIEQKLCDSSYIFFRLKETHFLEQCLQGVTINGFYYMCYDVEKGEITGFYYDSLKPSRIIPISLTRREHRQPMRLV